MVVETWLIPIFDLIITGFADAGNGMGRSASAFRTVRVLRVLRTARIIRVARYMPELMILIKGLMVAARSVFFTLVLLLLVTYVFSIAITQLAAGTGTTMEAEQFPNALVTVLNLIIVSTMPDQKDYYEMVRDEGWETCTVKDPKHVAAAHHFHECCQTVSIEASVPRVMKLWLCV